MRDIHQDPSGGNNWLLPATDHDRIFARRLRSLRESARLTQRQLAEQMTVAGYRMHQTTIAKIEAGDRPVVIGEAICLARIIGVDLADLVTEPGSRELSVARADRESCARRVAELAEQSHRAAAVLEAIQAELAEAREHLEVADRNVQWLYARHSAEKGNDQ